MQLITQQDFETKDGQEKIIATIHNLEQKVHELGQKVHELAKAESVLEQDLQGYG